MKENDLVRLAKLISLGAKTTRLLADSEDKDTGRVDNIGQQIESLADQLLDVALELEASGSSYH